MIKFKNSRDRKLFCSLHPVLLMIFMDMYNYAYDNYGVELTVTQTVTTKLQDKLLRRTSSAHREGRAIDIRTKDLDLFILMDIMEYIEGKEEYKNYWYEKRSGGRDLAYYHFGTAEHLHLAIHSVFAIK